MLGHKWEPAQGTIVEAQSEPMAGLGIGAAMQAEHRYVVEVRKPTGEVIRGNVTEKGPYATVTLRDRCRPASAPEIGLLANGGVEARAPIGRPTVMPVALAGSDSNTQGCCPTLLLASLRVQRFLRAPASSGPDRAGWPASPSRAPRRNAGPRGIGELRTGEAPRG